KEISLRNIDKYTDIETSIKLRRKAIENYTNIKFEHIQQYSIDIASVTKKNIENMIGVVQVPLGVAGPLSIKGEFANGTYYIPLATTEGALVASVNRGCSVISKSGGSNVCILQDEMTRAPVFKFDTIVQAKKFCEWVKNPDNFNTMKEKAKETTRFGELLKCEPFVVGNTVYLRFSYDTKDAMGMNMVTIATEKVTEFIIEKIECKLISLSGNMCIDKKPASINTILGRGTTVVADVIIPKKVVENTLKSTPTAMVDVNYRKNLLGSIRAGSLGFNAHAANIIGATYLACGQDIAHVVEGSLAITTMELTDNEDLYCSVTLPALPIGTVGGGTTVGTQEECLKMLGVNGSGIIAGENSKKLAEIIAVTVLAGEISLIGAQATGHLASAHKQLGR
ncbi:MAG: hydroxymethylglutaryl-CoA reductase (NADPH), partial [Methanosarcinaceae archaeon]|nr:hydroxymethylglutaryl-CoA reductase (NADPH) [Methanosarcinaceae archaeon]